MCDQYFISKLLLTCIPDLSTDCQSENSYKIHKDRDSWQTLTLIYFQGVWRQAATSAIISAISDKLQECLGSTSAKVYISLRIFSSHNINRCYAWIKGSSVLIYKQMLQFSADPPLLNLQCLPSFWVMTWNSVTILNRILIIVRDFHRFWYL